MHPTGDAVTQAKRLLRFVAGREQRVETRQSGNSCFRNAISAGDRLQCFLRQAAVCCFQFAEYIENDRGSIAESLSQRQNFGIVRFWDLVKGGHND